MILVIFMLNPKHNRMKEYLSSTNDIRLNEIYNESLAVYENCVQRGMTEKTAKGYQSAVAQYLFLANPRISPEMKYQDYRPSLILFLQYCRDEKCLSYSALRNHFNGLNNYFAYKKDIGEVSINPIPDFRQLYLRVYKEPDTREIMQLTVEDVEMILKAAQNRLWRAVIAVLAFCGLRREELTSLDVGDVDFEKRIFYLKKHCKRSNRKVPFTELVMSLLLDYLELRIS